MSIETLALLLFLLLAAIILGAIMRLAGMVADHAEQINKTTASILDAVSILKSELMTPADKAQPYPDQAPAVRASGPEAVHGTKTPVEDTTAQDSPLPNDIQSKQRVSLKDKAAVNEFFTPGSPSKSTRHSRLPINAVLRTTKNGEKALAIVKKLDTVSKGKTGNINYVYGVIALKIEQYDSIEPVYGETFHRLSGGPELDYSLQPGEEEAVNKLKES